MPDDLSEVEERILERLKKQKVSSVCSYCGTESKKSSKCCNCGAPKPVKKGSN
jgi:rubrerythrin